MDVYDALRTARPYKPALDHDISCAILLSGDERINPHQFDPRLLKVFHTVHDELATLYERIQDRRGDDLFGPL